MPARILKSMPLGHTVYMDSLAVPYFSVTALLNTNVCEAELWLGARSVPSWRAQVLSSTGDNIFSAILAGDYRFVVQQEPGESAVQALIRGGAWSVLIDKHAPGANITGILLSYIPGEENAQSAEGSEYISISAPRALAASYLQRLEAVEQLQTSEPENIRALLTLPQLLTCRQCPACEMLYGTVELPEAEEITGEEEESEILLELGESIPVPPPTPEEDEDKLAALEQRTHLLESLKTLQSTWQNEQHSPSTVEYAHAMNLAAVDYHRRERAQFWRDHFYRLSHEPAVWEGSRDTLIFDSVTVEQDWHLPKPRARKPARILAITARMGESSTLKAADSNLYVLYPAVGAPEHVTSQLFKDATYYSHNNPDIPAPRQVLSVGIPEGTLLEVHQHQDGSGRVDILLEEKGVTGLAPEEQHQQLPIALTPPIPIATKSLEEAILETATQSALVFPAALSGAAQDIVRREPPRLRGGVSLPSVEDFNNAELPAVEALYTAVKNLDSSYVAVQGPPGSGKTFVGSHVIARLVAQGWKIGIVAQSHAVVENMLSACLERGVPPEQAARSRGKSQTPHFLWREVSDAQLQDSLNAPEGFVFAGTAWDFSSEKRFAQQSLDLLVIDEAGQYALANTLAVARACRSMLLLGDPQQLPQVSTASHDIPVNESALGWLSGGNPVLDPAYGYFLSVSWRMHPALCASVSRLSYEGRLVSAPAAAKRALSLPSGGAVEPGLNIVRLDHEHASVRNALEAERIAQLASGYIGSSWTEKGVTRELEPEDIVVVAAYGAQVEQIRSTLIQANLLTDNGEGVRVGTVDKFQGQEAPVTLVSLAASNAQLAGRSASFLLSPNRLNVAISRGQWRTDLVCGASVERCVPQSIQEVRALGGFVGLSLDAI